MDRQIGIDITPDKTLLQKVGLVGYSTAEALAELLDNSIDARIEGQAIKINLLLDFEKMRIVVRDDGQGMGEMDLKSAMTVARGGKPDKSLGRFGIGLKSACSYLANMFVIKTSKVGSNKEYEAIYDEDKWLSDKSLDWSNFKIKERTLGPEERWHGTSITMKWLTVPMYPNQVTTLKKNFGRRYAPFLNENLASITINTTPCKPIQDDVVDGSRKTVEFESIGGSKIRGHLELLKKRSIGGQYGIDLYRHNRLIRPYVKFGFPAHPETARIVGKLDLDHVPVNFQKNNFVTESREYRNALNKFKELPELRGVLLAARSRGNDGPTAESVFKSFLSGSPPKRFRHVMRAEQARDLLRTTEPFDVKHGGKKVRISIKSLKNGPLYTADWADRKKTITINRESSSFAFVKNPLFLIGMIAAELRSAPAGKDFGEFIRAKNEFMESSLKMTSEIDKKNPVSRNREIPVRDILGYGLSKDLIDMHDYLKESFPYQFQFTAMSTLVPYQHNIKGKNVYTIHTVPNLTDYLRDTLVEKFGEAIPVLDQPNSQTINAFFDISGIDRIIAIRGFESISGSTVAEPEKAIMDLTVEVLTYGIPVEFLEVRRIFQTMTRRDLINFKKMKKYAKFIKKAPVFEEMIKI